MHLAPKLTDLFDNPVGLLPVQNSFAAGRTEISGYLGDGGTLAFVDIGHVARVVHQFRPTTTWTPHRQDSLREQSAHLLMVTGFR
jgi:hypothetical protein